MQGEARFVRSQARANARLAENLGSRLGSSLALGPDAAPGFAASGFAASGFAALGFTASALNFHPRRALTQERRCPGDVTFL